ncbi:MAG TPA: glycosyltransferase family 39 protein [Candidatus Binataceae bacterium]|nr:glycosyltransferase family 39 protein [Candidatus Binataceae bacterium]
MPEIAPSAEVSHSGELHIPPSAPSAREAATVAVLSSALFLFHLGSFGLWEPDEGRYAEIAREMIESGGLIVPHLNYVAYIEKPPLLYWATALSMRIFGVNEFAARLPVAIAAVIGVLAGYYFVYRVFDRRRAILAAAILATSPLYAVLAQTLTTDMMLAAMVTIAWFALFLHWREGGRWCWIAYVAMALAVLAKGPVGAALPILATAAFLLWNRELRGSIGRFRVIPGIALMLAIAAPWFVVAAIREPGFTDFYFIGEHLRRALDPTYSHTEPFYFYFPVIVLGLLPWSLMSPLFAWSEVPPNPARRFCICAATVTIAAFSCANAKLIPYVLPAAAPISVLIADGIATCAWPAPGARAAVRPPDSRILREVGPLLSLMGVAAIASAIEAAHFRTPYVMAVRPALVAIGLIMLAGGMVATAMFRARRAAAGLAAITITMAFALIAGGWARIDAEPLRSYADLSRTVAMKEPDATLICYHRYVQSLAFYNRRRVILVGQLNELDFGAKRADDAAQWFPTTDEQLLALWKQPKKSVLLIDQPELERLGARLAPYELIAAEGRKRAIIKSDAADSK